jgi:hypothetical protein
MAKMANFMLYIFIIIKKKKEKKLSSGSAMLLGPYRSPCKVLGQV